MEKKQHEPFLTFDDASLFVTANLPNGPPVVSVYGIIFKIEAWYF